MSADPRGEELVAVIAEIRQRVRARNRNGVAAGHVPLPDLTPLLHARDAAEAKAASIGTVNPRPGGFKNGLIQKAKRLIARALDWHVREQVEFNRGVMACVQATIESLNECKQALAALAGESADLRNEARELKDIRSHWSEWRIGWERKLAQTEIQFLRSIAELQAAFQHRVTLADANYREQVKTQHDDFERALARQSGELQRQFWEQMARVRTEYDRMIHSELRLLRQRASLTRAAEPSLGETPQGVLPAPAALDIDWMKFSERFRGSEEDIRARQQMYVARFRNHSPLLDIGCGRGEILQIFRDAGIPATGIDSNDDCIALCRSNGLDAEKADLFTYLSALPDASLGGIVCCQVVEHLPRPRVPEMIRLAHAKLRDGGLLAIETPNPECLAIFATHFYLDPTHEHPIPPALANFYLEEAGFGRIEIERLSPARESMPSLAGLPDDFRREFFGYLDYAVFGIKLA